MEEDKKIDKRIGSRSWEARSTHGRKPIFEKPEQLESACFEYFRWVEDNPLYEEKATQFQGVFVTHDSPKMRAMTIGGLCIFLDIARTTWVVYKEKDDFKLIATQVEEIIYAQKLEGSAADLLNPNIIARELGLKDASTSEIKATIEEKPLKERTLTELEAMLKEAKKKEQQSLLK